MFLLISAFLIPLLLYIYLIWTYDYWKKKKVPFPEPIAVFGNIKDIVLLKKFPGACHREIYWEYPNEKFVGIYQLRNPSLLIRDPELIKRILVKDFDHFMNRGFHIDEKREPLTGHLVNLESNRWRILRNKLTPAFSSGKIKNMFPLLVESSNKLQQFVQNELGGSEGIIELRETTARFTTDVIGSVAFGLQFNAMSGDSVFREMGKKALQPTAKAAMAKAMRHFVPWIFDALRMRTFPDEINSFFTGVVRETMSYREKIDSQRNDFLQLMIQLKKADFKNPVKDDILFTDSVIAAQAFVFFLAGFETSSTTMSFCMYELSKNVKCQDKALEEINKVLEKHGSLNYDAVIEMNYLENILLETMRLYPPVSGLSRVCTKPYQIPGTDVEIDPGVAIVIPVYALQHDPEYFPDPEQFIPERFDDKDILKSHTYMPFGEGPRICIGQRFAMLEMKLALVQLIKNYEMRLSEKTVQPLVLDPKSFILAPVDGIWIKLVSRKY
ncbi:probable cytochrome P450 6a13 [Cimex lectularius]|uniref:Cytochrome P450 n=1 Tax=Cimex lectularius TaxID=79782 RepID=A0A8I6RFP8_CIMLE|nr:probable cytochrome P450 6a13 [Cimex lectularius]